MVSEGVDIPRLSVGVYATTTRTDLFFRQAVGRFVRSRPADPPGFSATVSIPADSWLLAAGQRVEEEHRHQLRELDQRRPLEYAEYPTRGGGRTELEPLAAQAQEAGEIIGGVHYRPEELARARSLLCERGWPEEDLEKLLIAGALLSAPSPKDQLLGDRKKEFRGAIRAEVNAMVAAFKYVREDVSHREFWTDINRRLGLVSIKDATLPELERGVRIARDRRAFWEREYPHLFARARQEHAESERAA